MGTRRSTTFALTLLSAPLLVAAGYVAKAAGDRHADAADVYDGWKDKPVEPFTDGEATFQKILETLRSKYVDSGLSEDDFYRAASAGLLSDLDPARRAWNKLLTPGEYSELLADLQGEVVGIGLDFSFDSDSGMGLVKAALPGTPAAAAGLAAGDRLLQVDGQGFKGKQLRDVVYAIRGKVGTSVTLTLLRDAKVFDVKLTRARIAWDEVETGMLDDKTALLSIHAFTKTTAQKAKDGLTALAAKAPTALIVDLRGCAGGAFDAALATANLLLPPGATVVRVRSRDGGEEVKTAAGGRVLPDLPTSVLIDGETASGCELLAAALKQDLGATLVGSRTFGKWSMQTVEDLPNHYAIKYTTATFFPPDGTDHAGTGLTPDVPVTADPAATARLQRGPLAARLGGDVQLQAARSLLERE